MLPSGACLRADHSPASFQVSPWIHRFIWPDGLPTILRMATVIRIPTSMAGCRFAPSPTARAEPGDRWKRLLLAWDRQEPLAGRLRHRLFRGGNGVEVRCCSLSVVSGAGACETQSLARVSRA